MASTLVISISQAISQQENSNPTYNNPGSLIPSGFTYAGQVGTAPNGLAIFDTPQDGWNALYSQVQLNINRGLTLNQFFAGAPGVYAGYAPASAGNDPATYAANVANWTGIDPNVPLNQVSSNTGTVSTSIAGGSAQPLIDLSGDASTTPTSDILTSLESAVGSIDLTDPLTDVALLAAGVAAVFLIAR